MSVTEMKKTRNRAGVERCLEFNFRQIYFEMSIIHQVQMPIRWLDMWV